MCPGLQPRQTRNLSKKFIGKTLIVLVCRFALCFLSNFFSHLLLKNKISFKNKFLSKKSKTKSKTTD